MSDTTFSNGTVITSNWLNDVNDLVYGFVDNINALRQLDSKRFNRAETKGYYTSGDGGGGVYYYDSLDITSSDNGGSTIVAADGGRWKLIYQKDISACQFGAKFDNSSDDTSAWNAAILFISSVGGGCVYGKMGATSYVTGTVYVPSNVVIDLNQCTVRGTGNSS